MKWEDKIKEDAKVEFFPCRIKTNIECPKCGRKIYKRTDITLTTYPAQYKYECSCGWWGSAFT